MRRSPFRPWFECLEERTNPGVVTVSFAAGTLTLTGSSGADSIAISQPSFGVIQLVGDGTTPIRIGATGPIIPAATPVTFGSAAAPVKTLNANLQFGADTFTIDETAPITLAGNLNLNLGSSGAKTLTTTTGGTNTLNVGGTFTVTSGSGADNLTIDNFNVAGAMTVNSGSGADNITIGNTFTPPNNTVGGALTITTGVGAKVINLDATDVTGLTTLNLGTGNVVTGVNATVFINTTDDPSFANPETFNGGLRIQDGFGNTGADNINIFDGNIIHGAGLGVALGGGNNFFEIGATVNTAGTSVTTGNGNNNIIFFNDGSTTQYSGPFVVRTGSGADTFTIDGPADFLNSVNVNLGAGNDSLTLADNGAVNFAAGFLSVFDGGAGFNQKTVTAANLTVFPQFLNFF